MLCAKISLCYLLCLIVIIKTEANSSACEQKERNLAALDFAKEAISKAKEFHPSCFNDGTNISSNASSCGIKEKVSGYLDIASILIDEVKRNYSSCGEHTNLTKVVHIYKDPVDCLDILERGVNRSGVYTIRPKNRILEGRSIDVYCDMDTVEGGWTVIQRRGNFSNKIDFYRDWNNYKKGFGNLTEEFWIGNENIFALTNQGNYLVRFDLKNTEKDYRYATYSPFWIDDENAGYMLHLENYSGNAGDGMKSSNRMKFSTKDQRNDKGSEHCTALEKGGWWYNGCGLSNLNGLNVPGGKNHRQYMHWSPWTREDSLLEIEIKIRPKV